MPVVVGIACPGDVEAVLQCDQTLHRIGRRAVHADLSVPVDGHEAKRGVHLVADHRERHLVALGDHAPVVHAGASQGIDSEVDLGAAEDLQVHDVRQVTDVGAHVVMAVRRGRAQCLREGHPLHACEAVGEQGVCLILDPTRDVRIRGTAVRRVVLEAPVLGRVVRGGDDDTVGEAARPAAVAREDRVGDDRCRRVPLSVVDHHVNPVGRQHLEGAPKGRLREGMGVDPQEKRPVDLLLLSVQANGLGNGEDVVLVEGAVERGATMPRGAEGDPLLAHRRIGPPRVVRRHQPRDIRQHR